MRVQRRIQPGHQTRAINFRTVYVEILLLFFKTHVRLSVSFSHSQTVKWKLNGLLQLVFLSWQEHFKRYTTKAANETLIDLLVIVFLLFIFLCILPSVLEYCSVLRHNTNNCLFFFHSVIDACITLLSSNLHIIDHKFFFCWTPCNSFINDICVYLLFSSPGVFILSFYAAIVCCSVCVCSSTL